MTVFFVQDDLYKCLECVSDIYYSKMCTIVEHEM